MSEEAKPEPDDAPAPVLAFKPRQPDQHYPLAEDHHSKSPYCRHLNGTVDQQARKLLCRACGAQLDPFDFVLKLARRWDRRVREMKDYQALNARLAQILDAKGRIHITASGTTVRVPGPDGVDIEARSGSSFAGRIHQIETALDALSWKAQRPAKKGPRS